MKILQPTDDAIRFAAKALRNGELIGLPTETVYGIGASALDREAILKTYRLKRRPSENPLIVHVNSLAAAVDLVASIPDSAVALAKAFWPGPMTLVLPKSSVVPIEATGGLDTIAIRVPTSPEAQAVIVEAGLPVAAPSANTFMGLSPTRAEHISPEILSGLACVIDGGPCLVGLESTVIDCTGPELKILRPGSITKTLIEARTDYKVSSDDLPVHRSPGQYSRHYSPKTPIRLVEELGPLDSGICFGEPQNSFQLQLPSDPTGFARGLYSALHALDEMARLEILIEEPPQGDFWDTVWDRLNKAAGS